MTSSGSSTSCRRRSSSSSCSRSSGISGSSSTGGSSCNRSRSSRESGSGSCSTRKRTGFFASTTAWFAPHVTQAVTATTSKIRISIVNIRTCGVGVFRVISTCGLSSFLSFLEIAAGRHHDSGEFGKQPIFFGVVVGHGGAIV